MDIALGVQKNFMCFDSDFHMNTHMKNSQDRLNKICIPTSEWYLNLPRGASSKAGVSMSTAISLQFMLHIGVSDIKQIEAFVNGLIRYWQNNFIKRLTSKYHTPAEVWSSYNYFLEKNKRFLNQSNSKKMKL